MRPSVVAFAVGAAFVLAVIAAAARYAAEQVQRRAEQEARDERAEKAGKFLKTIGKIAALVLL